MMQSIDTMIQAIRRIAMKLRPGILDDLGIVAALEWHVKEFEKRTGITCGFIPTVASIDLDADISTALFRIVQEALTNVALHARATSVDLRLHMEAESLILEVEDNGMGIEEEKILSPSSLGIMGMRERVQRFGGCITLTGSSGTGTKVTVKLRPAGKRTTNRSQRKADEQ
jgi:signal transduction histidine kinase